MNLSEEEIFIKVADYVFDNKPDTDPLEVATYIELPWSEANENKWLSKFERCVECNSWAETHLLYDMLGNDKQCPRCAGFKYEGV